MEKMMNFEGTNESEIIQDTNEKKDFQSLADLQKYLRAATVGLFMTLGFTANAQEKHPAIALTPEQAKEYVLKANTMDKLVELLSTEIQDSNLATEGDNQISYGGYHIMNKAEEFGIGGKFGTDPHRFTAEEKVVANKQKHIFFHHIQTEHATDADRDAFDFETVQLNSDYYSSGDRTSGPTMEAQDFGTAMTDIDTAISQLKAECKALNPEEYAKYNVLLHLE